VIYGRAACLRVAAERREVAGGIWHNGLRDLLTSLPRRVIQAPNEPWHRATPRAPGMATRLAITPRNKEGQVHYYQPEAADQN
jgi:hypothetical protein